ncbi:hypothetical protein Sgly_0819 [Syntrophobotulus glycolicus DSM 8271]|uniref:Wadjet protein JetD C-terminal domain-containing protein n=1 Tax=Syntrophobotulus glycolicus (strain DSM 8271 / FlGlyR) TaxID=645991 RepID=F0T1A8_SYNGF|nr:DUF3322 domain-containing protein [Syntrophobotulus glycolicus]ADY55172.1 hypothetical protein Sgly_0819 [Syntrophobotulus glycolicus DSM 8271]
MCTRWSEPQWIREELRRRWDSGRILRALLTADDLFPLRLPLKRPKSNEVNANFAEISHWIKRLRDQSRQGIGFGYELIEKEMAHRQSGRNLLPTHAVIPTVRDALRLLKKEREADKFLEIAGTVAADWPPLREWAGRYPHKVLASGDDWNGILAVLRWFFAHPRCGLYLRQLDIPGVDTKFIEHRKGILTELLTIILPEETIDSSALSFEQRFGLRAKPVQVRMRLLDQAQYLQGLSDLTIPVEQLKNWSPAAERVFITENEINGLCFPDTGTSLVIFGLGYSVDILKEVAWLKEKNIYYWGDLDTHGFAMLDQVRSFLPQTCSMLMDESTLFRQRQLWSVEDQPFGGQLTRLTPEEHRLLCSLQDNTWGKGVRLEQERISFQQVKQFLSAL